MSIAKWTNGRQGASGKNAGYITRDSACDSVSFHNLDELEGKNQFESKTNAISYAYAREDIEDKGRTHYRLVLSWDGKEETGKAREMTHEYLSNNLKDSRAIVAIHQDTDHTHAHVWVDARQIDEKKIHISKKDFERIRDDWTKQYDHEYKTNFEKEYQAKYEQTHEWKKERVTIDKQEGKQSIPTDKPERAEMTTDKWREKDERDAGVKGYGTDKEGLGRNQYFTSEREQISEKSERAIIGATQQINRAESEARELHQDVEKLAGKPKQIEQRGELER